MADLDPIIQPIEADITDLTKKLRAAEEAGNKLRKEEIKRTRDAEKKKNAEIRKGFAQRLTDAKKLSDKKQAIEVKAIKKELAIFKKAEAEKTKIAVTAAKKRADEAQRIATQRATAAKSGAGAALGGGALIAGGAIGLKKVADGFGVAVTKARELETALVGLNAVAKANDLPNSVDEINSAATRLAEDGTLSIEDAAQSLKLLISQGNSLERSFQLTGAVKEIAALENISGDAGQATQDFFKSVLTNSQELLENASPSFRKLAKDVGGFTKVTEDSATQQEFYNKVLEKSEGLTESYSKSLETGAARQKKFNQELDLALADIGSALEPVIASITGGLTSLITGFREFFGRMSEGTKTIIAFGAALIAALPAIASIIAGLKIMAVVTTFALGPLGLIIAAVAGLTAVVVALAIATDTAKTKEERLAKQYFKSSKAADEAAESTRQLGYQTDEAARASQDFLEVQKKIPPATRKFIEENEKLIKSLKDRDEIVGKLIENENIFTDVSGIETGIALQEFNIKVSKDQLKAEQAIFESRKNGNETLRNLAEFRVNKFKDQIKSEELVLEGLKAQLELQKKLNKEKEKEKEKDPDLDDGPRRALKKSSTQIKEATKLLNKYFMAARAVNDEYRQQNENLATSLGLFRKLEESPVEFERRTKSAFETINAELRKVDEKLRKTSPKMGMNFEVSTTFGGQRRSQADLNKQALFEFSRLSTDQQESIRANNTELDKMLKNLEEHTAELERQREIYSSIEGDLSRMRDSLDGVNQGLDGAVDLSENWGKNIGQSVKGLANAADGANKLGQATGIVSKATGDLVSSIAGIAGGIGVAITLMDQLFDSESEQEMMARRRLEIADRLQTIEERRAIQLELQNSLLDSQLAMEQARQDIALKTLDARKELDILFGKQTAKETERQQKRAEKRLKKLERQLRKKASKAEDEIESKGGGKPGEGKPGSGRPSGGGTSGGGKDEPRRDRPSIDFTTREGQEKALAQQNRITEQKAALGQAKDLLSKFSVDDFEFLTDAQLLNIADRLGNFQKKAGPRGGSLSDPIAQLKKIVSNRRERRELKAFIADKGEDNQFYAGEIDAAQDRILQLNQQAGSLEINVANAAEGRVGQAVKKAGAAIRTIERARELGQEVVALGQQADEQRQQKAINRLQDIIDDNARASASKQLQTDDPDKQRSIDIRFAEKTVAGLRKAIGFKGGIDKLVERINNAKPGFEKDRDMMLLDQLRQLKELKKTSEDISTSSNETAKNTASLIEFGTDRQAGLLDLSRGMITNALGGFSIKTAAQGLQLSTPDSVNGISQALGTLSGPSVQEKQLNTLDSIDVNIARLVAMAEGSGAFSVDQVEQAILSILSRAEGAAFG